MEKPTEINCKCEKAGACEHTIEHSSIGKYCTTDFLDKIINSEDKKEKTRKCDNCGETFTEVYVISEAVQTLNLTSKEYSDTEILQTLRTECECGQILSEGDVV